MNRPPPAPLGLVHGDFQSTNVIVRPDGEFVALEWELPHIGDPREDLGWCKWNEAIQPPGLMDLDEERFCREYARRSGLGEDVVNPRTVGYFSVLSAVNACAMAYPSISSFAQGANSNLVAGYIVGYAVHHAATNAAVFSSQPRALIPMYPEPMGMLDLDPPQGPQVRKRLNPLFDRAAAERSRSRTREVIDQRIDGFIERGSADLIRELTGPVVATITAEGVGLPVERADEYAAIFHDLLSAPETEEELSAILARLSAFLDELRGFIAERRQDPREDWLSALIALEIDGRRMDDEEVLQNAHLLFNGGVDTTSGAMAWSIVHLHRNPDLRLRIRRDPSILPTAVDEFLRFYPPFVCSARTVTRDHEIAGVRLRKGERAMLAWAAANRDPDVFADPTSSSRTGSPTGTSRSAEATTSASASTSPGSRWRRSWPRCASASRTSWSTRHGSTATSRTS